jgi:hypothetical protein
MASPETMDTQVADTPMAPPDTPGAPEVALAKQYPPLTIRDHIFRSRADIATYIDGLPVTEQYAAQKDIRDHLLKIQAGCEDFIYDLYEYTEQSKAYEKVQLSRKDFLADNEAFIQEVNNIKEKRDVRKESLKRLTKHLTSQRGLALLATIDTDTAISGKNFIADLANIFSKVDTPEGVAWLNTAITARNRRPRSRGMRPRAGVMPADATAAKGQIAQQAGWPEEDLSLEELRLFGLRYGLSGLLEEGEAETVTRPQFADEIQVSGAHQGPAKDTPETRAVGPDAGPEMNAAQEPQASQVATPNTPEDGPTPATDAPTPATDAPTPVTNVSTPATDVPTPATDTPTPATDAPTPAHSDPTATPRKRSRPVGSPRCPTKRARPGDVDDFVSQRATAVNTSECDCHMDAAWKNTVEQPLARATFTELREMIRPIAEAPEGSEQPCLWHLSRLCSQLQLKTSNLPVTTLTSRLREVWAVSGGDSCNIRVISSSRTHGFFIESDEFRRIRDQHNLGVFKFAPVVETSTGVQRADIVPKTINPDASSVFTAQDVVPLTGFYGWLVGKDQNMRDVFIEEARMYQHHLRQATTTRDGIIPNMYYSLSQQLIRQDPALYELHVNLRQDGETRLLAFPQCPRFFDVGQAAGVTLYKGDTRRIRLRASRDVQDEVVLGLGVLGEGVEVLPQSAAAVRAWLDAHDETRELIQPITAAEISPSFNDSSWKRPSPSSDLICTRPGTPLRYSFTATTPYLSLASGFVAVSEDNPQLLENGVRVDDVAGWHRRMTIPERPRGLAGGQAVSSFPPAVELTDLGPISNALVGRMDWDSPAVEEQRRLVLTGTKLAVQNFYKGWRGRAKTQVLRCWEIVQERERKFYGTKSYFVNRDQDSTIDLTADDEVYGAGLGSAAAGGSKELE